MELDSYRELSLKAMNKIAMMWVDWAPSFLRPSLVVPQSIRQLTLSERRGLVPLLRRLSETRKQSIMTARRNISEEEFAGGMKHSRVLWAAADLFECLYERPDIYTNDNGRAWSEAPSPSPDSSTG